MTTSELGSASRRPGAPAREQQRGAARGHAEAGRLNQRADVLHGVVHRQRRGHRAAGAVDVQVHVVLGILAFEEEQLRRDQVGQVVVDDTADEDDPVAQKPRVDVVRALAAVSWSRRRWGRGSSQALRCGWNEADAAADRLRLVHGEEGAELRHGPSEAASSPEVTARSWRRGSMGHAGSRLRPGAEAASEVGVHGSDRHGKRIGDRDQQVGGDVLEPALDLGEVCGRASRPRWRSRRGCGPGPRGGHEAPRPARAGPRRQLRSEQNSQRSEHITAPPEGACGGLGKVAAILAS